MATKKMQEAKKNKKDEFYTLYKDVEHGVKTIKTKLRGKRIYCNCDSPESSFVKYFDEHFEELGLKSLVATGYNPNGRGTKFVRTADGRRNISELNGDGDFASEECRRILNDSDVVITNPPFSKESDFIELILDYNKKFYVICHQLAASQKKIGDHFVHGRIWFSQAVLNGGFWFEIPNDYECTAKTRKVIGGKNCVNFSGIKWISNIDFESRYTIKHVGVKYDESKYAKFDNCDAINVRRVEEVPDDYYGVMGVPITFLVYCNPKKFKILGMRKGDDGKDLRVNGKPTFSKYLIQRI